MIDEIDDRMTRMEENIQILQKEVGELLELHADIMNDETKWSIKKEDPHK